MPVATRPITNSRKRLANTIILVKFILDKADASGWAGSSCGGCADVDVETSPAVFVPEKVVDSLAVAVGWLLDADVVVVVDMGPLISSPQVVISDGTYSVKTRRYSQLQGHNTVSWS